MIYKSKYFKFISMLLCITLMLLTIPTSALEEGATDENAGNNNVSVLEAVYEEEDYTVSSDGAMYDILTENMEFAGGSGTEEDPYHIETAGQLNNVRNHLDKHFILTSDIDLSVYDNWEPIGSSQENLFRGILNGNNHKIFNLTIDSNKSNENVGFFKVTDNNAKIKNIGFENIEVIAPYRYEKEVSPTTTLTGHTNVGGVVGYNKGIIMNCYVLGNINGHSSGGIVGTNEGEIRMCYSEGNIRGNFNVGGLVGSNIGQITECYSNGNVMGETTEIGAKARFIGGLAGRNGYESTITNSYSTGTVIGGDETVGGLVSDNSYYGTITNCYWDIETSGQSISDGGTGKTTSDMMKLITYQNWDFDNIWSINEGADYPKLQWQQTSIEELSNGEVELYIGEYDYDESDLFTSEIIVNGEGENYINEAWEVEVNQWKDENISKFKLENLDFDNYNSFHVWIKIEDCLYYTEITSENNGQVIELRSDDNVKIEIDIPTDVTFYLHGLMQRIHENGESEVIAHNISNGDSVPAGSYRFQFTSHSSYDNGVSDTTNKMNIYTDNCDINNSKNRVSINESDIIKVKFYIDSTTNDEIEYRYVMLKPKLNETGSLHHTSVNINNEDTLYISKMEYDKLELGARYSSGWSNDSIVDNYFPKEDHDLFFDYNFRMRINDEYPSFKNKVYTGENLDSKYVNGKWIYPFVVEDSYGNRIQIVTPEIVDYIIQPIKGIVEFENSMGEYSESIVMSDGFKDDINAPNIEGIYTMTLKVDDERLNIPSDSNVIYVGVDPPTNSQPSSFYIQPSKVAIKVGETRNVRTVYNPFVANVNDLEWSSDNPNIATVDSGGTVEAKSVGSTTITAKMKEGNYSAECKVFVYNSNETDEVAQPTVSGFDTTEQTYHLGDKLQLEGIVSSNGQKLDVVTVTISGPNGSLGGGDYYSEENPPSDSYDLSNIPALEFGQGLVSGGGDYEIRVWAKNVGGEAVQLASKLVHYIGESKRFEPVEITTPTMGSKVESEQDLTITWNEPTNGTPEKYNIFVTLNDSEVYSLINHTETSLTIPGDKLSQEGTYTIEVYALAGGWEESSSYVTFEVEDGYNIWIDNFIDYYDAGSSEIVNVSGIINSPYKIERISYSVVGWCGKDIYGHYDGVYATMTNSSNSFDLSKLKINTKDDAFNYKGKGNYYVNIWIKEQGKESRKFESFTVEIDRAIEFEDDRFETAVRKKINKPTGEIFISDVEEIVRLNLAYDDYIENLYGIQFFKNLKYLDMPYLQITSIDDFNNNFKYFTQLNGLEELGLYGCNIEDISWVTSFPDLIGLYLSSNNIIDITPIKDLDSLQFLDLSNNHIEYIEAVKDLDNLKELNINYNPIKDYTSVISIYDNLYDNQIILKIPELNYDNRFERITVDANSTCSIETNEDVSIENVEDHVFIGVINESDNTISFLVDNEVSITEKTITIHPPKEGYLSGKYCLYISQFLESDNSNRIQSPISYIFEIK